MEQEMNEQEEPLLITPDMLVPFPKKDERIPFEKGMSYFPLFVLSIISINLFIYLGEIATGALRSSSSIIAAGALKRELVLQGEYWRLISASFLHASWGHLLGNSAFLYVLGMAIEHAYGIRKAAILYGVSALTGSLLSMIASPGPSIGASGAVFGLMGSLATLIIKNRDSFYLRDRNIGVFVGAIAIFQIILGFRTPYIDNFCHIGGFLGGAATSLWLRPNFLQEINSPVIGVKAKRIATLAILLLCSIAFISAGYTPTLAAVISREMGKPQQVIAAATRGIQGNPQNDYAYFLRGEAYLQQKQYPKAIRDLNQYLTRHPSSFEGWVLVGDAYSSQGKYDSAIQAFTKALAIQPNVHVYNSRGYAYILKGNYKLARADFIQLLKMDKRYAPGYGNLGLLSAIAGDYANAAALIKTSLKLDKSLSVVNELIKALEYEQKGQKKEALASYKTFANNTKNNTVWLAEFRFAEKRIQSLAH